MTRARNFSAGPAALPLSALEKARDELLDFHGSGMSVMEQSHRGAVYEHVHEEATALIRELLGLGDDFAVLFLQGGASQQFAQVPMNLLGPGKRGDYVVNGVWGEKALAEATASAKLLGGEVRTVASTREGKTYRRVPRAEEIASTAGSAYVHFTSNETIHGVEFAIEPGAAFPRFGGGGAGGGAAPVVCDMSSDFMWRPMDLSRFDLVYAGAQKNLGPSGVVIVLVKKALLDRMRPDLPAIFRYRTHVDAASLYNTPPSFGVYLVRNVLLWIKEQGGLAAIERTNREKARRLYAILDAHPEMYTCPVERGSRSRMNVVFTLPDESTEKRLLARATEAQIVGVAGHRSVGGLRASLYNAVSLEWVDALVDLLEDFARNGR